MIGPLGGVPREHRSDSLSAAFPNLDRDAREDLTRRYEELIAHYGMTARATMPASPMRTAQSKVRGHLKRAIEDAFCCADRAISTIWPPTPPTTETLTPRCFSMDAATGLLALPDDRAAFMIRSILCGITGDDFVNRTGQPVVRITFTPYGSRFPLGLFFAHAASRPI